MASEHRLFPATESVGRRRSLNYGVHVLDLLLWWLGDYTDVAFFDDAVGGVEANCEMKLRLRSGSHGIVEIGRMRKLRNTCLIEGELGAVEIELWDANGSLYFKYGDAPVLHGCTAPGSGAEPEAWWTFLNSSSSISPQRSGSAERHSFRDRRRFPQCG